MRPPFELGLHEVGDGVHAWLQPDGSWGWSNAGLVVGDGVSLLVDTLFDLTLTRRMLDAMAPLTGRAPISTVVNTHANGDHTYGNVLLADAEIVASAAAAAEMVRVPPAALAALVAADHDDPVLGAYLRHAFGAFTFEGVELRAPTRTFTGALTLDVGGVPVELVEVGPAHTAGDVMAFVPSADVVFTGDICFIDGTPIIWAGPVSGWLEACDLILERGTTTVVPGHGPVTGPEGVRAVRDYLTFIREEAARRHAAGMDVTDAADDIDLGGFADWSDPERIVINVEAVYRELDPARPPTDVVTLFRWMARWWDRHRRR